MAVIASYRAAGLAPLCFEFSESVGTQPVLARQVRYKELQISFAPVAGTEVRVGKRVTSEYKVQRYPYEFLAIEKSGLNWSGTVLIIEP